jgi:hypothetical protein
MKNFYGKMKKHVESLLEEEKISIASVHVLLRNVKNFDDQVMKYDLALLDKVMNDKAITYENVNQQKEHQVLTGYMKDKKLIHELLEDFNEKTKGIFDIKTFSIEDIFRNIEYLYTNYNKELKDLYPISYINNVLYSDLDFYYKYRKEIINYLPKTEISYNYINDLKVDKVSGKCIIYRTIGNQEIGELIIPDIFLSMKEKKNIYSVSEIVRDPRTKVITQIKGLKAETN